MFQFDYALYDRLGQLVALAEVKSVYGESAIWASQLRRNLLTRGVPEVPFFLILTPDRVFVWKRDGGRGASVEPNCEFDATALFGRYLPRTRPSATRRLIHGQAFELVVFAWLSDLMRNPDDPELNPAALAEIGFAEAVRQGRIEYQQAA